jgi:hypothetical protein
VSEIGVLSHAVAVATNRDDVAMVDEPIDERRRHHLVAKDPGGLQALSLRPPARRVFLRHNMIGLDITP